MKYPASLTPDGSFFVVTFRDIPEAITQGESREEAVEQAAFALESALDFYLQDERPVPLPSDTVDGEVAVHVEEELASRILEHNGRFSRGRVTVAA